MTAIFHTIISNPLYNGFIFLMHLLPFLDAGAIIIIFTIVIKLILLPLSIKASKAQIEMKKTEKDLAVIREQYKDKQEQSQKIMDYYKQNGINPFASFLILLIQLPILIGLYRIFFHSGLPVINYEILYPFITAPSHTINMMFLGLISLSGKSWILALLAGVTTYFQVSTASLGTSSEGQTGIAKAMTTQMKYFLPVLMTFIAYTISSAIALYLITSNLFAIAQEIYIKKKYHKAVFVE